MRLEIQDVEKSFGEKRVLQGVSMTAEGGRAFGLLGRNGAGKTTSIRILMQVIPADSGSILFNGQPLEPDKVPFGYLPEERGLYPKKKIIDQLVYFAELKGMRHAEAVRETDRWLERLSMQEYRNKRLDVLSKGNQQKIQLITALVHNPPIVILDEPFSGLDPVNAMLLKDVVREEIEKGKIVLFSSHQMNYIEEFCDDIAILNGGRVALTGALHAIKRQYPRNRLLLRSPEPERIRADVQALGGLDCTDMQDGALLWTMASPEDRGRTMQLLTERYELDEIKVFEPSLNDIFIEYAGKEAAHETVPDHSEI